MSPSSSPEGADTVLAERHGPVLLLTLNRPERLNAWTSTLEERYFDLLDEAEDNPEVRVIVVTGAGRGFCAGADMEALKSASTGGAAAPRPRPITYPASLRKPLIAAINGPVAGLGLVQAVCCDIRFCVPDAKITSAFSRRGLIAEYGISWILPRLVGTGNAMDLLLSGRVIRGEEAYSMGLVNRIVPADSLLRETLAYAEELATLASPTSVATIKDQIRRHLDADFAHAVRESDFLMHQSFSWPDLKEGVQSYLDSRPPEFSALPPRSRCETADEPESAVAGGN